MTILLEQAVNINIFFFVKYFSLKDYAVKEVFSFLNEDIIKELCPQYFVEIMYLSIWNKKEGFEEISTLIDIDSIDEMKDILEKLVLDGENHMVNIFVFLFIFEGGSKIVTFTYKGVTKASFQDSKGSHHKTALYIREKNEGCALLSSTWYLELYFVYFNLKSNQLS